MTEQGFPTAILGEEPEEKPKGYSCPVTIWEIIGYHRFKPFDRCDWDCYAGVQDQNPLIARGESYDVILATHEPDDGGPNVPEITVIDHETEREWLWLLREFPVTRGANGGIQEEWDAIQEALDAARQPEAVSEEPPTETSDDECGHYAFAEELDHFHKCTEDEADTYMNEGHLTVVVSKPNGDYKIEVDQWWGSEGVFEMTVNFTNLQNAMMMFAAAYKAHDKTLA